MANILEKLADSVPSWGAKLSYGEPTIVGGQELVPVALVVFGFGGGEGSGDFAEGAAAGQRGEGSGGGGGGYALPIGAYVGTDSGAVFRANPVAVIALAIPLASVAGWALSRIIRAAR